MAKNTIRNTIVGGLAALVFACGASACGPSEYELRKQIYGEMMNNPAYGGSQIDKEIKYVDLMLSNICDEGGANYEKAWCHNRICVRGTNRNGAFYCDKVELTDTECAWSQFRGIEVGGGGVTVTCGPLGEQEIFAPRGGKDAEELGQAMYRILRLKQKQ